MMQLERVSMFRPRPTTMLARSLVLILCWMSASVWLAHAKQEKSSANSRQAKAPAPDLKPFLGTWKGSFQGQVFAILTFYENRGDLEGTLNNFDLGRDKDGNLDDDTHVDSGSGPIFNVHIKPDGVYFLAVQKDQYSPSTEWKFLPKNANEGELTQLIDGKPYVMDNGVVAKPILMLRDRPKP